MPAMVYASQDTAIVQRIITQTTLLVGAEAHIFAQSIHCSEYTLHKEGYFVTYYGIINILIGIGIMIIIDK